MLSLRTALCLGVLLLAAFAPEVRAQKRHVDFRYATPYWYSALGVPEDWHKPLASDRGELLYDFGPGPYVIPLTRIGVGIAGVELARERQHLDNPRLPVVSTVLSAPGTRLNLTTFSAVPEAAAPTNGDFGAYQRRDGISGALGWARPTIPADPAFRNVAWGITRPIHYRLRTDAGAKKRVVLGFAESYKPRLGERLAWMRVEGAPDQTADLALTARMNEPQVFLFEAADSDGDGWIDVEVMAPQGHDPNTTLAALWMYPEGTGFTRANLIAGGGSARPELSIDAGTEMLRQAPRIDVIEAVVEAGAGAVPVVTIQTRRDLQVRDGALWLGDRPFVTTDPAFTRADTTAAGWTLALPAGTRHARVLVFSGDARAADLAQARGTTTATLLDAARRYWQQADIPYGHIHVPDPDIQALLDASLRTLYQGRETLNGRGQFNPGFTLYRGLWAGDAAYYIELANMLGDRARAREGVEGILAHQTPEGFIEVMRPFTFWRESAQAVWTFARYARLVDGDPAERAFLDRYWPDVMRIVEAMRRTRERTVGTGEPYEGLFPPSFNDGGIGQISAEYSSVLWMMTSLQELGRVARAQGRTDDAARLDRFYHDLRASFDVAFARDARRDAHGHLYLPVPVGKTGPDEVPQLAQWAALEAHIVTDIFPVEGEYLAGTLGILQDAERQGLPISTGWLPGGVWAGFGSLYGAGLMLRGEARHAADVLYAMANHASPVGTWVEEQPLVGEGDKLAGDMPHTWHSALFTRMVISMLAHERGADLLLLGSVPAEWLAPGSKTELKSIQTMDGLLTLTLTVSRDGRTATLQTSALGRAGQRGQIVLHTKSLRAAGFERVSGAQVGAGGDAVLPWGRAATVTFRKR